MIKLVLVPSLKGRKMVINSRFHLADSVFGEP